MTGKTTRRRAARVVIVGGSSDEIDGWCNALHLWGFEPTVAERPGDVLLAVAELGPMALILDLEVPKLDAVGLVAVLREHESTRDLAIVAVSDDASPDAAELLSARGVDRLLGRPADPDEVAAEIERIVAHRQRPQRVAA